MPHRAPLLVNKPVGPPPLPPSLSQGHASFHTRSWNRGCLAGDNGAREAAAGSLMREHCQSPDSLLIQQSAGRPTETLSPSVFPTKMQLFGRVSLFFLPVCRQEFSFRKLMSSVTMRWVSLWLVDWGALLGVQIQCNPPPKKPNKLF